MRQSLTYILLLTSFISFGTTIKVTRVIDGDTFETEKGDKIRLIGINAPEISEVFGRESKDHLISLIEGKYVDLKYDKISQTRDRYNRLLCYIILDGSDINKRMILDGFAFAYLKYNFENRRNYEEAQMLAMKNDFGIWSNHQKDILTIEEVAIEPWIAPSPKGYFIGILVILLVIIGLYSYFRK